MGGESWSNNKLLHTSRYLQSPAQWTSTTFAGHTNMSVLYAHRTHIDACRQFCERVKSHSLVLQAGQGFGGTATSGLVSLTHTHTHR